MNSALRFEEALPDEMEAEVAAHPICYIPSGTLEWHSHHLPLGLDGLKVQTICEDVAVRAGGIVLPTTYWAIEGMQYPWTTRVSPALVEALYKEIFQQMAHVGFRVALALIGHYPAEHYIAIKRAAVTVMRASAIAILPLADFEVAIDAGYRGDHAGRWETSLLWSVRPDLVHLDRLPAGPPEGVWGEDPRLSSSREEGDRLRALIVDHLVAMTQRLEHHTPGERSAFLRTIGAQVRFMEAVSAEMLVRRPPPLGRSTYVDALHAHVTRLENTLEAATGNDHRAPLGITEAYISFLLALRDGQYRQAAECADRALTALSSGHS